MTSPAWFDVVAMNNRNAGSFRTWECVSSTSRSTCLWWVKFQTVRVDGSTWKQGNRERRIAWFRASSHPPSYPTSAQGLLMSTIRWHSPFVTALPKWGEKQLDSKPMSGLCTIVCYLRGPFSIKQNRGHTWLSVENIYLVYFSGYSICKGIAVYASQHIAPARLPHVGWSRVRWCQQLDYAAHY